MLGTPLGIFYMLSHCILPFLGSDESKHKSELWGLSLEWRKLQSCHSLLALLENEMPRGL